MSVQLMSVILRADDLDGTAQFYCDVLGFSRTGEGKGFVGLTNGKAQIMLATPNAHEAWNGPAFTGSLYLYVDDVDSLWARLSVRTKICYPIESFDYGMREFAIYDNNGYVIQFGQATENAPARAMV
jgi:uncharacterized glyoxalase superfamily protein PhnB